jgi:putative oxidoreductase
MEKMLSRLAPACFVLLRIVAGVLFACHGAQKLFGVLGGHVVPYLSQAGAAGVIELVAGVLIAIGLFTRYAAFLASGEMAVAYFQVHAPGGFWPVVNHGELAAIYCFLFLYIAARGPGTAAADGLRGAR